MPQRLSLKRFLAGALALAIFAPRVAVADSAGATAAAGSTSAPMTATAPAAGSSAPASPAEPSYGGDSNEARARALVDAAINLTDSERAVKLLWQATEIDPTFAEAYIYLAFYYNSRSNFGKVVDVYQRLVKFEPKQVSAYLNIGEAYMSFSPPRLEDALPYYRRALELDPTSSFAALRLGEIYAQQGNRSEAVKFLRLASGDRTKNPDVAAQADKFLRDMGS
jgi:tetratricopeptide (TPR) repeat protein